MAKRRKAKSEKALRDGHAWRVALTGGLASGKSTVLKFFKSKGWACFSADEAVSEIYRRLGLSKDRLREKLKTPAQLKAWEKKIHPLVRKFLKEKEDLALKKGRRVLTEVPLLFEARLEKYYDGILFVFTSKEVRRKRALSRGMAASVFERLNARQMSDQEKALRSDFVVFNEGNQRELMLSLVPLEKFLRS